MNKKASFEIVSLNREFMSFDIEGMSVEELDRRLELAIAVAPTSFADDCGANCVTNGCTANCGLNTACTANCGTKVARVLGT